MTLPERWFGLLLRLLPARFRARHGEAMRETFARAYAEHRAGGRRKLAAFLARTTLDLTVSGVRTRLPRRGRRRAPERRHGTAGRGGLFSWTDVRLGVSWLDVKLGLRMLGRYPGLSLVSVVGMAVATAIGAGWFGFLAAIADPSLPLDEGERVVSLQNADARNPGNPDRQSLHDFLLWRETLGSVRDLSAFTSDQRNLIIPERGTYLVRIAEMTASGFRVARVPPLLGRPLLDGDERQGAPPVVVVGYDEWRRRFDGDAGIVGSTVRLGTTEHTVVGVMPEGFRFPINHQFWVPLRIDPAAHALGEGPAFQMFGRLADGVSMDRARAELVTLGRRRAAAHPDTHAHLRPQIMPYTLPFFDIDQPWMAWLIRIAQLGVGLLLVVVSVNVAILVYARTATRTGEIAVRSALGASRTRVVTQLFAEALVLSVIASAVGLGVAGLALEAVQDFQEAEVDWAMPFWVDLGLTPGLVAYAVGLAVLAGVIVGVLPALRATGRNVQAGLREVASRGSRMQLGRTWTILIVVQVAIAVAALPYAVYASGQLILRGAAPPGYAVDAFLRASLSMEREEAPPRAEAAAYEEAIRARFLESADELLRRLEAEPSVVGVAFASGFPGSERFGRIEVEGGDGAVTVRVNRVDADFFSVFDVPVLAGRGFTDSDAASGGNAVIVDRVFAEAVLGGAEVLGRRVRDLTRTASGETEEGPWLEIVGVVPGLGVNPSNVDPPGPKLYQPVVLADAAAGLALAIRMRNGVLPAAFAGRLREASAAVDPALQLHHLRTATAAERERQRAFLGLAAMIVAVTISVLLLSAAGVYAMMSFTVARRRREIGIRTALGAAPRRLLASIFVRSGAQLGGGVLAGLVVAAALDRAMGGGPLAGKGVLLLPLVAGFMVLVGLLAAAGPARRGLAVQPTEALREE